MVISYKISPYVYEIEYFSPPPVEGEGDNKIMGFGDVEENQRVEKKKKLNFWRFYTFDSSKR